MGIYHLPTPRLALTDAASRAALLQLRASIQDQIEQDLDRIDQCLAFLDSLDGDPDLDADNVTVEADAAGNLFLLGRSSDDEPDDDGEPSLAHPETVVPRRLGGKSYRYAAQRPATTMSLHAVDLELDRSDDEPSLGSPEQTRIGRIIVADFGRGLTGADVRTCQMRWGHGGTADLEESDEGGGDDINDAAQGTPPEWDGVSEHAAPVRGRA